MAVVTSSQAIGRHLLYLASDAFKGKLTRALMQEAIEQIDAGFASSRDPYGQRWQPLKVRRGQPLRDTGRLQRSFSGSSDPNGFKVGTDVVYANVHQFGYRPKRIPARPMLPDGTLGVIWTRALEAAAQRVADLEAP